MKTKNIHHAKTIKIAVQLPLLPGSITTARSTCGKPQCACHRDPGALHGTYYRWTGVWAGQRTTKTLSRAEAQECRRRIKNYRDLQKSINTLLREGLKKAPWTQRRK